MEFRVEELGFRVWSLGLRLARAGSEQGLFNHFTYMASSHPPRIPFHLTFYHFFPRSPPACVTSETSQQPLSPFVCIYIYIYLSIYLSIHLSQVGAQSVLVRDGSSQSDGNHSVLVKALNYRFRELIIFREAPQAASINPPGASRGCRRAFRGLQGPPEASRGLGGP